MCILCHIIRYLVGVSEFLVKFKEFCDAFALGHRDWEAKGLHNGSVILLMCFTLRRRGRQGYYQSIVPLHQVSPVLLQLCAHAAHRSPLAIGSCCKQYPCYNDSHSLIFHKQPSSKHYEHCSPKSKMIQRCIGN